MKLFLSLLPLAAFYIAFKLGDIYWATGAIMVTYPLEAIVYRVIDGVWSKSKICIALAVILVGGITIAFQSEEVIKWKITIGSFLIACTLLIAKYVFKVDLIQKLLSSNGAFDETSVDADKIFSAVWVWQVAVGVVNLWVMSTQTTETWVDFKTFGLPIITLVFMIYCIRLVVANGDEKPFSEEKGD